MQQLFCADCGVLIASSPGPRRPNSWADPALAFCEADEKKRNQQVIYATRGVS